MTIESCCFFAIFIPQINPNIGERMKKIYAIALVAIFVTVVIARSNYTGYTRKSGNVGCNCHGKSANTAITVEISGPSQVQVGSTTTYQVTISGGSGSKVCVDIAASSGTLKAYDPALKLLGTELITNGTKSYSGGKYTYSFNYVAPLVAGTQTLYATGLSSTSSGWNFAPDKTISIVAATDVEDLSLPREFGLDQNYPNPFNPSTFIKYRLQAASNVSLKVFDALGNDVAALVDEYQNAGIYQSSFSALSYSLSSGIYFYRLTAGSFTETKKMLLMK